jgi:hypothetical protein
MNKQELTVPESDNDVKLGQHIPDGVDIKESISVKVYEESGKSDGKKRMVVKLIQAGESKNGYYYNNDIAESIADHVLQRPQMYMDHSMVEAGRSFKDLAAIATDSYKKGGAAYAIVEMVENPQTNWIYNLAKQFPGTVGASIDARAKVRDMQEGDDGFEEGKTKYIVEDIVFLNSVDFVTYPAAGGYVTELMASQATPEKVKRFSHIVEDFNNKVANLINDKPKKEKIRMSEQKALTKESLVKDYPALVQELQEAAISEANRNSEDAAVMEGLENELAVKESQTAELQAENDDLRSKLDDYETREKIAARKAKIDQAITESGLDKEFCSDVFVEDLMKLEEDEAIQARIADRKALVETTHGEVTGNGERADQVETKESQETEQVFDETQFINSIASYKAKA